MTACSRHASMLVAIAAATFALAGCERAVRNMYDQPKLKTYAESALFANGKASRPPPERSVARAIGTRATDASGTRGQAAVAALAAFETAAALPVVADEAARLARGRERYAIYCQPCHGARGEGDGTIVERGFPAPPTLVATRLREAPDRHLFDVIGAGWGVMLAYGDRVAPADRWAIVAWIRHLQRTGAADGAASGPRAASGANAARPR